MKIKILNKKEKIEMKKCPYCGKYNCIEEVVFIHAENYGASDSHLPCIYCGKMICVSTERTVNISITKSDRPIDERDF